MYVRAGGRHAAVPRERVTEGGGWVTSYISARYTRDTIFVHMYVCMRVRVYGRQECSSAKRTLGRRIKYVGDSGAQLCQLVQDE